MKLLAIETATEACSVALVTGEGRDQRQRVGPRVHAEVLLPWIAELLAEAGLGYADLDAVAVDRGPGGFTSLRLGLGVAQGIGLAHGLRCHPVSSLAALALAARPEGFHGRMLAALDARMGEVYAAWFRFDDGTPVAEGPELLCAPEALQDPYNESFIGVGSAFASHDAALRAALGEMLASVDAGARPDALAVAALAHATEAVAAHELVPVYLRDRVTG